MDEVKIRVLKNGPYEVKGAVTPTDQKRNPYTVEDDAIYLCRCGQSANKPFCDGTHTEVGFKAEETAERFSLPRRVIRPAPVAEGVPWAGRRESGPVRVGPS